MTSAIASRGAMTKLISIVSPCGNEEANIEELAARVRGQMSGPPYRYEHIVIDNCSTDSTVAKLAPWRPGTATSRSSSTRGTSATSARRITPSCSRAAMPAFGSRRICRIRLEMIADFIAKWEQGYKLVMAVKPVSRESKLMRTPCAGPTTGSCRRSRDRAGAERDRLRPLRPATHPAAAEGRRPLPLLPRPDPRVRLRGGDRELLEQPRRMRGVSKNNVCTAVRHSDARHRRRFEGAAQDQRRSAASCSALLYCRDGPARRAKLMFWNHFSVGIHPHPDQHLLLRRHPDDHDRLPGRIHRADLRPPSAGCRWSSKRERRNFGLRHTQVRERHLSSRSRLRGLAFRLVLTLLPAVSAPPKTVQ